MAIASPQSMSTEVRKQEVLKSAKIACYIAALNLNFRKHSGPTPADDITDCGNYIGPQAL